MIVRIGSVMQVFSSEGKVKVAFSDTKSSSLPLPMLTFNGEFSMPKVGDTVVTLHFENGSSKGVCLGTYYGAGNPPEATTGYLKVFDDASYLSSDEGEVTIAGDSITFECSYGTTSVDELLQRIEALESEVEALSARE